MVKNQIKILRSYSGFFISPFYLNLQVESCNMNFEKENFLRTKFISLLQKLKMDTQPHWGKMNVQQMIEHFTDVMMVASGKIKLPIVTPPDRLPRLQEFMMSEPAPLKKNT